MIPAPFEYHRPQSLQEAIGLLAQHGEDARVVAGGHSLVPMMKLRLAKPGQLVDLQDLSELRGIHSEAGTLVIGAMTTQHGFGTAEPSGATCGSAITRAVSRMIGQRVASSSESISSSVVPGSARAPR